MAVLGCAVAEISWLEKRCVFAISAKFRVALTDKTNFLEHFYVVFGEDISESSRERVIETENEIFEKSIFWSFFAMRKPRPPLKEIERIETSCCHAIGQRASLPTDALSSFASNSVRKQPSFSAFSHIGAEGVHHVHVTS